jgi:hypothetical protein
MAGATSPRIAGADSESAPTVDYDGKHGPWPTLGDNRPWRQAELDS